MGKGKGLTIHPLSFTGKKKSAYDYRNNTEKKSDR